MGSNIRRSGLIGGVPSYYRKKKPKNVRKPTVQKEEVKDFEVFYDETSFEATRDLFDNIISVQLSEEEDEFEDYVDALEYEELEESMDFADEPSRMSFDPYIFKIDLRLGKQPIEVFPPAE